MDNSANMIAEHPGPRNFRLRNDIDRLSRGTEHKFERNSQSDFSGGLDNGQQYQQVLGYGAHGPQTAVSKLPIHIDI